MAAAVVAGLPAAASAAVPDGGTNATAEVTAAVKASPVTSDVPDDAYTVTGVRTAAEGSWATAHLVPDVASLQPADAVLHHTDAGWKLVGLGGAEIGCSVPAPVRGAFDLTCTQNGAGSVLA